MAWSWLDIKAIAETPRYSFRDVYTKIRNNLYYLKQEEEEINQHDIDSTDAHNGVTEDEDDIVLFDGNGLPVKSANKTVSEIQTEGRTFISDVKMTDGQKLYLSNTTETYLLYNSGAHSIELWVEGEKATWWEKS